MNSDLIQIFKQKTGEILTWHPEVVCQWTTDEAEHCVLEFPKQSEDGFDVSVEVMPHEITVHTGGYHIHMEYNDDADVIIQEAFGLVRDLLSPHMRVREKCSNGKPYRWYSESLIDGQWRTEGTTGLLFWNYFGRRTENIYQNHVLSGRLDKEY